MLRQFTDAGALPFTLDVVHIVLPFFDVGSNPGNPAAAFAADYRAILSNLAPLEADIVIHAPPLPGMYRGTAAGGNPESQFLPYLTELYEIADELDLPLFDAQHLTGGYPVLSSVGMTGDSTVHLLPSAYSLWGRSAAKLVL